MVGRPWRWVYGHWMGFYGDLMGFYGDFMGFYGHWIGFSCDLMGYLMIEWDMNGILNIWGLPFLWGYTLPPKWMTYKGKSHENGWFGGPPILGNLHIKNQPPIDSPLDPQAFPCPATACQRARRSWRTSKEGERTHVIFGGFLLLNADDTIYRAKRSKNGLMTLIVHGLVILILR